MLKRFGMHRDAPRSRDSLDLQGVRDEIEGGQAVRSCASLRAILRVKAVHGGNYAAGCPVGRLGCTGNRRRGSPWLPNDDGSKSPKRFEEIAGYEVAEAVAGHPLAILPLGSLEFHGPHNPLGSDSIIISGIAKRVSMRTNGLLFPTIKFTQCPVHTAHFSGTVSVRPEVMTMYFAEVLRNISNIGFRKIFILNGHDGNIGPGRGAVAQVADDVKDSALLFVSWWEFLPSEMIKFLGMFHQANGGDGHGGPLETSAVAAFRPDLIHLDKARDLPEPPGWLTGRFTFCKSRRQLNGRGILVR